MEEQVVVNNPIQQSPVNLASPKFNYWLITIIVLVLALLLLGGIYILGQQQKKEFIPPKPLASPSPLSPTPTPFVIPTTDPLITANWKTYRNNAFGFSLNYPAEWLFNERESFIFSKYPQDQNFEVIFGEKQTINHIGEKVDPYPSLDFGVTVSTESKYSDMSLDQIIDLSLDMGSIFEVKDIKVDSVDAKLVKHGACLAGDCIDVYIKKENKIIKIISGEEISGRINTFNQIFSTFKFLDGQEDTRQLGDAATKKECLAQGGVWQKWGLAQLEYCQIPAKDAGKPCTDQYQCTYGCISETGIVPGKCVTYKSTFGCFSIVRNGKAEQALCVD